MGVFHDESSNSEDQEECLEPRCFPFYTYSGLLQVDTHRQIPGLGCTFEGISNGRRVAVKLCVSPNFLPSFNHEIAILSKLHHPNILRLYFDSPLEGPHRKYFVTEAYSCPLSASIDTTFYDYKLIMHQLASAIQYLTQKSIVHLDLTPENIFLIDHENNPVVKVTNFEKARRMIEEPIWDLEQIFDKHFSAPEILKRLIYKSSDINSLGKIFIYILQKFGFQRKKLQKEDDEMNLSIESLKNCSSDVILAKKLCNDLMSNIPCIRKIFLTKNLNDPHPFFWSSLQTQKFIIEIANLLESSNEFKMELYKGSQKVICAKDGDWTSKISRKLLKELKESRKAYCAKTGAKNDEINGKSITSLIMTIRNMIVHAKSDKMIEIVGKDDEAFVKYWTLRFPNLISYLHEAKLRCET